MLNAGLGTFHGLSHLISSNPHINLGEYIYFSQFTLRKWGFEEIGEIGPIYVAVRFKSRLLELGSPVSYDTTDSAHSKCSVGKLLNK